MSGLSAAMEEPVWVCRDHTAWNFNFRSVFPDQPGGFLCECAEGYHGRTCDDRIEIKTPRELNRVKFLSTEKYVLLIWPV